MGTASLRSLLLTSVCYGDSGRYSIHFGQDYSQAILDVNPCGEPERPFSLLSELDQQSGEITVLLHEWTRGKPEALEQLFPLVYPQLRQIAGALFRGERPESILQPTGVVNELFLKLVRQHSLRFEDREHFYSLCARLMRRVLLDHARNQGRQKRDGGALIPLEEGLAWVDARPVEILDLKRVLSELEALDPRKCKMVEFRFFLGFTAEETAELLSLSKATVDRELRFIRAWLYDKLHSSEPQQHS